MAKREIPTKIYLTEKELPKYWYNMKADMVEQHDPILNPQTLKPVTKEELERVFCSELVEQELNCTDRYIEIPQEIRDFYTMTRPSPLTRAYFLEKLLDTPAEIYYKFEGNNTSGSHKLNSAIAQAYYAKKQGLKGVTTETGAGQWGTALSMACAYLGLDCKVYMVKVSYEQKPFRREVMRTYGASVTPSPSMETEVGKKKKEEEKAAYARAHELLQFVGLDEFADALSPVQSQTQDKSAMTLDECIVSGLKEQSGTLASELLKTQSPMEIIDGMIIPALNKVGKGFGLCFLYHFHNEACAKLGQAKGTDLRIDILGRYS